MQSERTELLADLVASALDCAVSERAQFLSDVCGEDVALREEAESLLRFEENAREFIETPAYEVLPNAIANNVSQPVPAEDLVFPSEAIKPPIAEEPIFESETLEASPEEEPILESEATDLTRPEEQAHATELIAEPEPDLEPINRQEPSSENEATEPKPAQKPIVESEPTEPITQQPPIFESKATEPAIAQKQSRQSEDVIELGPERRRPEIEHTDRGKTVAIREESKPKPSSLPAKQAGDSFEIPAYPPKKLTPSRFVVWRRRAAAVAVILALVAMAVALISALRDANDARHERDVAESERSRSERINNYLQRILFLSDQDFTSVWPVPQNKNTTVTEMLDRIAPSVQKELARSARDAWGTVAHHRRSLRFAGATRCRGKKPAGRVANAKCVLRQSKCRDHRDDGRSRYSFVSAREIS